jgi:hypothetical protein
VKHGTAALLIFMIGGVLISFGAIYKQRQDKRSAGLLVTGAVLCLTAVFLLSQ